MDGWMDVHVLMCRWICTFVAVYMYGDPSRQSQVLFLGVFK